MRFLDIVFSLSGLLFLLPVLTLVFILNLTHTSKQLFFQERVGKNQKNFTLVKFRTMKLNSKNLPSHEINEDQITHFGKFLRKTKLDELPQLWNVLIGDMSLVGPRPCLESQTTLIELRRKKGVYKYKPGITGLAQIKKVDMSTPEQLSQLDEQMVKGLKVYSYFKYIILTIKGDGFGDVAGKR
jgi:O-antigen biosynthesis protein WbqP